MIRQGDLDTHEHEFVAAINRLTQILSTTPQTNEVAIRWLLDRCNGITVDVNGPTKMAIWALADIFHKRWYVVLPPAYLKQPFILAEALEIERARQANDDRGAFALRVQVQPGEKTASFVKVSRLKYYVLLYLDDNEKKVAFVDWNQVPVTVGETIVRVEGPKRQFFELDLAQEEHLNFYSLCLSAEL
ncbi:hypothetical protein CGCS363_v006470 [Colletotrichum siamense]|uniref:uncharacterized protein n=1 Tax=Colletotrichum siamense TaxID=690259 RepID=UPI00187239E2|nr:uncharacterized protein CGCS363_v006470 [Colletotrichum siamense]KAF5501767.1 hypothetical protein CGCS363_v006470 [Colletotrichum siamense]